MSQAVTPPEYLAGMASGLASRDGEVSLLNATIGELRAERAALRQAVAFFASAIKSGEPWTDTCEGIYRRVMVEKAS